MTDNAPGTLAGGGLNAALGEQGAVQIRPGAGGLSSLGVHRPGQPSAHAVREPVAAQRPRSAASHRYTPRTLSGNHCS